MSFNLGNTKLGYGLLLAPMAGVSDRAFRETCAQCGAEYTVTEMVSAKALHFNDAESEKLAGIAESELPCAVQIFGHEPDVMAEAADKILNKIHDKRALPTALDLNMGCPVKKIVSNCEGAALMKNPVLAGEIIKTVCSVSSIPVTVKIRAGWNDGNKNAVEMAEIAEKNGAAMICVHGRTREQMYAPPVDIEIIAAVKRAVSIPVVANGGIYSAADAMRMFELTGCDGVMVARGSMGNPWIFEEIKAAMNGASYVPPPLEKKLATAMHQIKNMVKDKGERVGLLEARRHLSYYIKGGNGASETRFKLNRASSFNEFKEIIDDFLNRNN